jgi:methylmalonyl-CoA mutase
MSQTLTPLAAGFPRATEAQWRSLVDQILKGADFERRLVTRTADGIALQPLYTAADAVELPAAARGPRRPDGAWDIRQVHGEADPAATNQSILEDLAGGVTSILVRIAAPGSTGLDYREPTLARALDGVLLDVAGIHLHAGEYAPDAAGSLIAVWRARAVPETQRRGGFGYDPLANLALTGALYNPLETALATAADLIGVAMPTPNVTALKADGAAWHAGGATEAQELALVLASMVEYLRAAERSGLAPNAAWPKIAVTLAVDADQFLGMAKLRAARLALARLAEHCGVSAGADRIEITASTSWRMLTRRDPWVNLLRTSIAAASAAMGGADAITVLPFTWPLGRPDAFARRIARNTHIVLQDESGLGRVQDPAGGSFFVDRLTHDLAAAAWRTFQDLEREGGLGAALRSGVVHTMLAAATAARRQALATGQLELTGTSAFPRLGDDGISVKPWEPSLAVDLPGERVTPLTSERLAEPFERLRDAADAARAAGRPMRVFLATLGPLAVHATRAMWMRNLLAAGGLEAVGEEPLATPEDAGRAFAASGARIACLTSSDAVYADLGAATVQALRAAGAERVDVAGRQSEPVATALHAAGIDSCIASGADRLAILTGLHRALGGAVP